MTKKFRPSDFEKGLEKTYNEFIKPEPIPSWDEEFDKIIDKWKEPEWIFERHDALIDYMTETIKTIKDFIHQTILNEREQAVREVIKELDKLIPEPTKSEVFDYLKEKFLNNN